MHVPAISIIMPVFNRQDKVARAVNSVLGQDFQEFELIIVDDASTDATVKVIESFHDPRIILLRQPVNRNAAAARNRGIAEAHSQLIAFIDSDDEFLPHKLGFVVDYFQRHPEVDALLDSFQILYPPQTRKRRSMRINPALIDNDRILEGVYARRISKATPALTARRQALVTAGLFDESLRRRQDFDLVVRLTRTCRCATTDQVLWRKYWDEDTITAQTQTAMNAILEMCRRNPDYLATPRFRVGVARDLAHHVLRLSRKRQFSHLRGDLRRFADVYGSTFTLRLIARGMIESAKRAITGTH